MRGELANNEIVYPTILFSSPCSYRVVLYIFGQSNTMRSILYRAALIAHSGFTSVSLTGILQCICILYLQKCA